MRNGFHDLTEYHDNNPLRPPDWRHRLVCELVNDEGRLPKQFAHDHWVRQTLDYERQRAQCETAQHHLDLGRRHPDLYAAEQLHEENGFPRWRLQGWLLTRQPIEAVADECGLSPGMVDAYANVFFDVADRLDATAAIVSSAIGDKFFFSLTPDDTDVLLKTIGYFLGPVALRRLGPLLEHPPAVPEPGEPLSSERLAELTDYLWLRLYVTTRSLPCDRHTLTRLRMITEFSAVLDDVQERQSINEAHHSVLSRLLELKWPDAVPEQHEASRPNRHNPRVDED